ncbi:Hsp20/alpha crystallin family protein [Ornithinibacillus halophilus]|uniref:HSP20 family protein n=1 Tax=Ornithinibacillus halophilus TaxID=930117 RepID=A0A1M5FNW0_9BACI|nr:Hsp20/alpha crystallin family protein [Ornithinibacillus halophilus]SHF93198.1 HSP20 family protein [Ornithinibacillus halophilus]
MDSNKNNFPNNFNVDLSPFRDFIRHMDRFFDESFRQMNSHFDLKPFWINKYETETNIIIEAELPGYKKEQIQLEILGYQLRISVEDRTVIEGNHDDNNYYGKQQSYKRRERVVSLPFKIPKEQTKAKFRDEKLTISIPKNNNNRKFIDIQ